MMFKRLVVAVSALACIVAAQDQARAQALLAPVENLVINRTLANVVTKAAIARGFAANDPRIAATLTGMGQVSSTANVVSAGVGTALAVAGAPVWLTVAAGLGVAVAGAGIALALNGAPSSSPNGSLAVNGSVVQMTTQAPSLTYPGSGVANQTVGWQGAASLGAPLYKTASCFSGNACSALPLFPDSASGYRWTPPQDPNIVLFTPDQSAFLTWYAWLFADQMGYNVPADPVYGKTTVTALYPMIQTDGTGQKQLTFSLQTSRTGGNADNPDTNYVMGGYVGQIVGNIGGSQSYTDLLSAYSAAGTSSSMYPAKVADSSVAQIANQAWQRAASLPGYAGLPYDYMQPLTASDVSPVTATQPVTLGDLLAPAADPGGQVQISPTVQPGTSTGTNPGGNTGTSTSGNVNVVNTPNVNVTNTVKVDLGTDPQTASPSLESTPTISMILSPIINLFPDLKAWAVPAHTGTCPTPTLDVFGKTFTMSVQCDLAEQHRTAISTMFLAVFALAALFIVLGA